MRWHASWGAIMRFGSTSWILNGARRVSNKESSGVRFYTTPSPEYADEIVAAFESEHPGIKATFDHDHAARFFARVLKELIEARCPADIMLLNRQQAEVLKLRGPPQPFRSPEAKSFPESARTRRIFDPGFHGAVQSGLPHREALTRRGADGL